ncbi:TPA: hypothetical protein ACPHTX_004344 [Vibrio antiquarius]
MLEIIDRLNLGEWATLVIVVSILWKTVFKSLVDSWFKNRLELQKQEVGNALQIQKDIALKQAEFEKVKLERVLPLFEAVNSAISEHKMVFSTYMHYVVNRCGSSERLEEERLKCDEKMIAAISSLSIYLPDDFRIVVYRLRTVVSCYTRDPQTTANTLRSFGAGKTIPPLAQDLYKDLTDCFHSMCAKYLGISDEDKSYSDLLSKYSLDSEAKTTKIDPENALAYKFLLLHEYYGSGEQVDAQLAVEQLYNKNAEN